MTTKSKIYCFCNSCRTGWHKAIAMAEDGHVLAQHICSSHSWISHDLGVTSSSKHTLYDAYYGKGDWVLEYVPSPRTHKGLQAAYKKHMELPEKVKEAGLKSTSPSVIMEYTENGEKKVMFKRL